MAEIRGAKVSRRDRNQGPPPFLLRGTGFHFQPIISMNYPAPFVFPPSGTTVELPCGFTGTITHEDRHERREPRQQPAKNAGDIDAESEEPHESFFAL